MNRFAMILFLGAAAALVTGGCTPYQPPAEDVTFHQPDPEFVLIVVLDLSGSYAQYMDGPAWAALTAMIRQFHQEHIGDESKIVLAQISNVPRAPVFEGSPAAFGKAFGGAGAFKDYLRRRSDPAGSRVHSSIADAIDYSLPFVTGKGKAALAIFSDMDENWPEPEKSEERLVQSLAAWGKKGGCCGMYWVELPFVARWRENLKRAGVKQFIVESSINPDPKLPEFGS